MFSSPARAQSPGSFSGAFSNAYLIPTYVCTAGSVTLDTTSGNILCNDPTGGSTQNAIRVRSLLAANFKTNNGSGNGELIMASLETAITTDTQVSSKNGKQSTAGASGSIVGVPWISGSNGCSDLSTDRCDTGIFPGQVTFYSQTQQLSATLSGCTVDSSGTVSCNTTQTIELLLSIMGAHSFNFIATGLTTGDYTLHLAVGVTESASSDPTSLPSGAQVDVAVAAGSLGVMDVKAETPFDEIVTCGGTTNVEGSSPVSCGP